MGCFQRKNITAALLKAYPRKRTPNIDFFLLFHQNAFCLALSVQQKALQFLLQQVPHKPGVGSWLSVMHCCAGVCMHVAHPPWPCWRSHLTACYIQESVRNLSPCFVLSSHSDCWLQLIMPFAKAQSRHLQHCASQETQAMNEWNMRYTVHMKCVLYLGPHCYLSYVVLYVVLLLILSSRHLKSHCCHADRQETSRQGFQNFQASQAPLPNNQQTYRG